MKLPQEACCFNAVNKHHSARRMAEPTPGRRASTKSTWDKLGVSRPDPKNTHHHSWKSPHPCRGRQPSPFFTCLLSKAGHRRGASSACPPPAQGDQSPYRDQRVPKTRGISLPLLSNEPHSSLQATLGGILLPVSRRGNRGWTWRTWGSSAQTQVSLTAD